MRYGVGFVPGMPVRRVVELAQRVEELGYDSLFIPDQTFHRDPFVVLALCAEATHRIQLGLALTNPYTRHPVQIARAAGLLAEVAEGRFVLGLGAGNLPRVLHGFGIPQTRVGERLREAIDVIRRLLAGETVDHHSETLVLNDVALDFAPAHPVPIYIGTRGPRLLRLAGEVADGVFMEGLFTPGGVAWALARVAEGAERSGRPLETLNTVAWQALDFVETPPEVEEPRFRKWAALLVRTTSPDVLREIGVSEEAMRTVAEEVAEGKSEPEGRALATEDIRKLLMVGTPAQIREQMSALRPQVGSVAGVLLGDHDQIASTVERFASEIVGHDRYQ